MSNIGENKGRTLKVALTRFTTMLIEEAREVSGLSNPQLDSALGWENGYAYRYALYPGGRGMQAGRIQKLENDVAKFLKRTAHKVVIENNALLNDSNLNDPSAIVIGVPAADMNLRHISEPNLELGYEDDWPTYARIKNPPHRALWEWQWGILWDKGVLKHPWTREAQGIPAGAPVESFLPQIVESAKIMKRQYYLTDRINDQLKNRMFVASVKEITE